MYEINEVGDGPGNVDSTVNSNKVLKDYLLENSSPFTRLVSLKDKGWSMEEGDQYFQNRREKADHPTSKTRKAFFKMTVEIGNEMSRDTHVFDLHTRKPLILDLCMAPGGFTSSAIKHFRNAVVHAITLPEDRGGHRVMATGTNLSLLFADVTMFAAEFGVHTIPADHPDATSFRMDRPYSDNKYDLVFCGGAVLRNQERAQYRQKIEGARLTLSQLTFAFHRIKPGGTLVLLLHRVETWSTMRIIHTMATLADMQLFKPKRAHAIKSSFYLVAKNVRSESEEAARCVADWKTDWYHMTFRRPQNHEVDPVVQKINARENVESILKDFGPRLIELGDPIWNIQADALEKSEFLNA